MTERLRYDVREQRDKGIESIASVDLQSHVCAVGVSLRCKPRARRVWLAHVQLFARSRAEMADTLLECAKAQFKQVNGWPKSFSEAAGTDPLFGAFARSAPVSVGCDSEMCYAGSANWQNELALAPPLPQDFLEEKVEVFSHAFG